MYRALVVTVFVAVAAGLAVATATASYVPGAGLLIGLCFWVFWRLAKQWDLRRSDWRFQR